MADTYLRHVYESTYVDKKKQAVRRTSGYFSTKKIIGRGSDKHTYEKKQGGYASKYYDPVARHERYMRERASLGVGKGRGSGGSGGSGRSSRGGSGGSARSAQQSANMAQIIQQLRDESAKSTEAQREVAKRRIEDAKAALEKRIKQLREEANESAEGEENATEVRGITQSLRAKIESLKGETDSEVKRISSDLSSWITTEKDSLEQRIAAIYKSNGKTYTPRLQADKQSASDARNKEVMSRADSIYKKQS